jgi:hypothetical protein
MADIARCENAKCLLFQRETRYPTGLVPKCRLCGSTQEVVRQVPDFVVKKPTLPAWAADAVGGGKPAVLQVAMYAPCTNPCKSWKTVSAAAESKRLHDVEPEEADSVAARLRLLKAKIEEADDLLPAAAGRLVQKVFVVPEWFFRKCVDQEYEDGQYTEEEMRAIVEGLLDMSRKGDLRDWLIVAGSIRWLRPVTSAVRSYPNGEAAVLEIVPCTNTWLELNTTVVVSGGKMILCYYKKWNGGDTGGPASELVTPEKLKSGDKKRIFVAQRTVREPIMPIRTVANDLVNVKWDFGVDVAPAIVPGSFTFRSLKMGVEICADADSQSLVTDVGKTLDVHFVVSCDLEDLMSQAEECGAVKVGGYLVQCDGNQIDLVKHAKLSFKVAQREMDEYTSCAGTLHGDGVAKRIFVIELAVP